MWPKEETPAVKIGYSGCSARKTVKIVSPRPQGSTVNHGQPSQYTFRQGWQGLEAFGRNPGFLLTHDTVKNRIHSCTIIILPERLPAPDRQTSFVFRLLTSSLSGTVTLEPSFSNLICQTPFANSSEPAIKAA